jgi:hypothetical protein
VLPGGPTISTVSTADAWYVLGQTDALNGAPMVAAIYEHQRACWGSLIDHLDQLPAAELVNVDLESLRREFCADCEPPPPTQEVLGRLVGHYRAGLGRPVRYSREDRRVCDPRTLAGLIIQGDLGERGRSEMLERRYTPLARAIYPTMREYRAAVDDAVYQIQHPDELCRTEFVSPVQEPSDGWAMWPTPSQRSVTWLRGEGKRSGSCQRGRGVAG